MTSLAVETWPIDRIRPFAQNARLHPDEQLHFITQSILKFGFVNPILVDVNGECIAGHGRLQAMRLLERTEVPVIVLKDLTEDQARAYRIADNQIGLSAEWDVDLYRKQLEEFMSSGFPMDSIGWGAEALDQFMSVGTAGLTDPESVPEPAETPIVRPGDLWTLGEHRLLCGDCTAPGQVKKAIGTSKPQLMVTDPPYGVDYDPNWRNNAYRYDSMHRTRKPVGAKSIGNVTNDHRADWSEAWQLFKGDVVYVWHGGLRSAEVAKSLNDAGFETRSQIIWAKPVFIIGRGNYHWQHEPCWYAVRESKKANWRGGRKQSTLWAITNLNASQGNVDDGKTNHSAQKPIACMQRPIENNSAPGDHIYDPFVGSGTSIIAAQMSGRRCIAIDIDPVYSQMAIERWQNFTGEQAKLGDRLFSEVVQERTNASSNSGISLRSEDGNRPVAKPKVRKKVHARLPKPKRSAVR